MEFQLAAPIYTYQNIQVSGYIRPCIVDLNQDGLGDIIAGERNFNSTEEYPIASFNYFENIGAIGSPRFEANINLEPNLAALGGINLKQSNFINNNSAITVHENQEEFIFITGSESGEIRHFIADKNDIYGEYEERLVSNISGIDVGEESSPSMHDIDNDNRLEIIVGNVRGGIALFESDLKIDFQNSTKEEIIGKEIKIIPNPALDHILLSGIDSNTTIRIMDVTGTEFYKGFETEINLQSLPPGLYILQAETSDGLGIKKFVKI